MKCGTRIEAPNGWRAIAPTDHLYFLASQPELSRALLVLFFFDVSWRPKTRTAEPSANILAIDIDDLSSAIEKGALRKSSMQRGLPPWVPEVETRLSLEARYSRTKDLTVAMRREALIKHSGAMNTEWLLAPSPETELNRIARSHEVAQNCGRFRVWVLAYRLFGEDLFSLTPRSWNSGRYDRGGDKSTEPLGRKNLLGCKLAPRLNDDDKDLLLKGYRRFRELGRPLTQIYEQTIVTLFGAKITQQVTRGRKILRAFDRQGRACPTLHQFRYFLIGKIGSPQIQIDRYGAERRRKRTRASQGCYSENVANLRTRVESDAYQDEALPIAIDGEPMEPLYVVHLVDVCSYQILGVGFSLGSERAEAYDMAKFIAAIDKEDALRLLGIGSNNELYWPGSGTFTEEFTDRGPGSSSTPASTFSTLTRTHSPMDKATGESSNPKSDEVSGAPRHLSSRLSPAALMRNCVRRAIVHNMTADVSKRLSPEMIAAMVEPNPNGIHDWLSGRGRDNGRHIDFEDAVRRYLRSIKVTVDCDAIWLGRQRYRSEQARDQGVFDAAVSGRFELRAYCLPMVMRQIWVEWQGKLLEVPAELAIKGNEEQLYISLAELEELQRMFKECQSAQRINKSAISMQCSQEAISDTGLPVDHSVSRAGRRKRVMRGRGRHKNAAG